MRITTNQDEREQRLTQWVAQEFGLESSQLQLQSVASDAGFRRYYRFSNPSHWLAVDAPPQTENTHQFVALARYLGKHQVNAPKILVADEDAGLLLVEDFGDELLYKHLNLHSATTQYQQVFDALLKIQACPDQPALIPRYDRDLLRRELQLFSDWFVESLLDHPLSLEEKSLLNELFTQVEERALKQPQTFVHRDFHSRNLLVCKDSSLGIIDFQGALWGPCTYDLVSLLRDCYLRWPAEKVTEWALHYRQLAVTAGLLAPRISEAHYLEWFDWMGFQRHIKVLGIFSRLNLRDQKKHYLKDLPLVIRYTLEIAERYPTLQPFAEWFTSTLLPKAQRESWYSDYRKAGEAQ